MPKSKGGKKVTMSKESAASSYNAANTRSTSTFNTLFSSGAINDSDQCFEEESVYSLLELFPTLDKDIIYDVFIECNRNVSEATEKLLEIVEEESRQHLSEQTDLAMIACSLLSEETTSSKKLTFISGADEWENNLSQSGNIESFVDTCLESDITSGSQAGSEQNFNIGVDSFVGVEHSKEDKQTYKDKMVDTQKINNLSFDGMRGKFSSIKPLQSEQGMYGPALDGSRKVPGFMENFKENISDENSGIYGPQNFSSNVGKSEDTKFYQEQSLTSDGSGQPLVPELMPCGWDKFYQNCLLEPDDVDLDGSSFKRIDISKLVTDTMAKHTQAPSHLSTSNVDPVQAAGGKKKKKKTKTLQSNIVSNSVFNVLSPLGNNLSDNLEIGADKSTIQQSKTGTNYFPVNTGTYNHHVMGNLPNADIRKSGITLESEVEYGTSNNLMSPKKLHGSRISATAPVFQPKQVDVNRRRNVIEKSSYSDGIQQGGNFDQPRPLIDPVDPLGWKEIFPDTRQPMAAPKPQKLNGGRRNNSTLTTRKPPWVIGAVTVDKSTAVSLGGHTTRQPQSHAAKAPFPQESQQPFWSQPNATLPLQKTFRDFIQTHHWELESESDHSAHLPDWMPHPLQSSRPLVVNKAPSFKPPPGFSNLNHQDKVVGHSVKPKLPSDTKPSASSKHSGTPALLEQNVMRNKLSFHGLKSPEDILRRYILEKYPVIVILRGLPGSGKSYLARQLIDLANEMGVEGIILSTDDYFMQRGQYVYNRNDLGTAHEWNQKRALSYVKESRSPIVIDNTNTVMWELLPYAQVAYRYKYDVQVFEPNTPWKSKVRDLARRNSHGVPMDSLRKMKERYEKITTDDVLDAVTAARRNGSLRHNLENQPEVTQVEKVAERTSQPAPLVPPSAITKTYSTQLSSHSSSSSSFSDTNTSKMSSQSSACDWWEPQGQRTPKQKIQLSSSQKENKNTANSAISQEFLKDSLKQVYVSLLSENTNKACTGSLEPWSTLEPTGQIQLEPTGQIQMEPTCQLEPELTIDLKSHLSNKPVGQLGQQSILKPNTDLKPHAIEDDFSCSDSESSSEEPEKESKLNSSCSTSCSFQSCCSNKEEMVVKYGSADDGEVSAVLSVSENRQNLPEEAGDDLASVETPVTAVEVKEFTFTVKPELKEVKPELQEVKPELKEVKHEFQEAKHEIKEEPELMEEKSELKERKPELKKEKFELKEEKHELQGAKHEIKEEKPKRLEESGLCEVETSKSENFSSEKVASEDVVNKVDPSTPAVEGPDNVDQCDIGAEGVAGGATGVAGESLVELERKVSALHLVDYSDSESGEDSITLEMKGNLPHEAQDVELNSESSSVSLTPSSDLKDCEPAQSPLPSSREQSPPSDEKDSFPVKRKKKRVKKGKVTGPFIGESVKAKSKTESWSNFLTPPAKDSVVPKDESGPAVVSERKCAETQCEMYYFSMLHKLNSQAFNKLQPLDLASSEVRVVTLPSSSRWGHVSDAAPDTKALPHTPDTIDRSTNTDETLEKEEIDLETLQSCFPEYSRRQLEDIMAICQNNLEWVTSHLLDSPALTDLVEEETCSGDKHGTVASPLKSLSHMCSSIISQTSVIDKDDLEMQVIQAGHDRLQRIENFARSRIHSWDLAKQHEAWPDQFNLEDFTGLVDPDECWDYGPYQADPHVNTAPNHNALPARPGSYYEYNYPPSYTKSTPQFTKNDITKNISKNDIPKNISKYDIETEVETLATDLPYPNKEIRSVEKSNKLYVPLDFLENLEAMYGSLNVDFEEEGLALDEATARKIYNCLKLQCTKKLKFTSNEQQLQNDEALARALQEEEKLQEVQHSSSQGGKKSVPGWTNQKPAWMCQGAGAGHSDTPSSVFANKHQKIRPLSVADTLNALRGSPGKKLKPFKFQKRMHGSATKSVWSSVKRQGRADSLHSIMEEEKAREEFQKEQLRIIQQTGDTHALATRIKRSELSQLYPSLSPDFLEEVFMNAGYSKEDTMKDLENAYGITAAPLPREVNQEQPWIYNEENVNRYDLDVEEGYESYYSDDSTLNFEEYRNEAQFYRGLAKECQNQAQKYQADNMPGAALFYRQKVKEYKELERSANQKAADVLFDKGTERLAKENTLDLHFYHLDEAVSAVNLAIMLKEDEFKKKQDKKNSFLNIVTGRGRNSKDGVPVLKPAIMNHLRDRGFRFEEKSPGMLKVYIGQRV